MFKALKSCCFGGIVSNKQKSGSQRQPYDQSTLNDMSQTSATNTDYFNIFSLSASADDRKSDEFFLRLKQFGLSRVNLKEYIEFVTCRSLGDKEYLAFVALLILRVKSEEKNASTMFISTLTDSEAATLGKTSR